MLFVGTKKQAQEAVQTQATRVNMPYVSERWLGGMLTNFQTVSKRVSRLKELEEMDFTDVHGSGLTKKELLLLEREKDKLAKQLGGIRNMNRTPSAMFVVDVNKEALAVEEAHKLGIPVVAIVDTNADPESVEYPIAANDDAIRGIELLTSLMADAVAEGLLERSGANKAEGEAAEQPSVTDEVLNDLGCGDIPQVTVYNKCDRTGVAPYDPDVLLVSAKTGYGLDSLLAKIDEILAHRVRTIEVLLPYDKLALADVFRTRGSVLAEEYRENGVYYKATVKVDDLHRFEAYLL